MKANCFTCLLKNNKIHNDNNKKDPPPPKKKPKTKQNRRAEVIFGVLLEIPGVTFDKLTDKCDLILSTSLNSGPILELM